MNLTRSNGFWQRQGLRAAVVLLMSGGVAAAAQSTNAPSATDFSAFRMIAERNIFNPNRRAQSAPKPHAAPLNAFALVGTLDYPKGRFAFFNGTAPEYRKVLEPDGTIAGYKVADITLDGVKLEAHGQAIQLPIGAQMRQESPGHWQLSQQTEWPSAVEDGRSEADQAPAAGLGGADRSTGDVLKRLMQRREKELK